MNLFIAKYGRRSFTLLAYFFTLSSLIFAGEKDSVVSASYYWGPLGVSLGEKQCIVLISNIEWGKQTSFSFTSRILHEIAITDEGGKQIEYIGFAISPSLNGFRIGLSYLNCDGRGHFFYASEAKIMLIRTFHNRITEQKQTTLGGIEFRFGLGLMIGIGCYTPLNEPSSLNKTVVNFLISLGI